MGLTVSHRQLVAGLADLLESVGYGVIEIESGGSRRPRLIEGYRPDLIADRLTVRARVIGEAKTGADLESALHAAGLRGWRCHRRDLPGVPDIAFSRPRVAVFVDGRFWHGHPDYFTFGKSGPYWDAKILRTQRRDRLADDALLSAGWRVIR